MTNTQFQDMRTGDLKVRQWYNSWLLSWYCIHIQ